MLLLGVFKRNWDQSHHAGSRRPAGSCLTSLRWASHLLQLQKGLSRHVSITFASSGPSSLGKADACTMPSAASASSASCEPCAARCPTPWKKFSWPALCLSAAEDRQLHSLLSPKRWPLPEQSQPGLAGLGRMQEAGRRNRLLRVFGRTLGERIAKVLRCLAGSDGVKSGCSGMYFWWLVPRSWTTPVATHCLTLLHTVLLPLWGWAGGKTTSKSGHHLSWNPCLMGSILHPKKDHT